ncbi:X2-like carbohydrate binding domain-containing protein [Cuneatibacter caecimuris]|uniref:Carbohydrate binding protein with CBMX2 domain n=1 Tax=Cuneatibacter caecimuris TaxID=1796618 RepID=A0A4Q7PNF7_9FIRM|nr:X2-like carbohydrate binding domain-containing protein [Cuneatibacter caecimuris]RZT00593.1 carbohydrate binding protein with CBMX2 domain [Cuneatibacter caecimuris]
MKSKRTNRFLALLLTFCMVIAMVPAAPSVAVTAAPASVTQINTVEDLKAFRDSVNGGNSYSGQTVTLNADLDLAGESNWTPIGTSSNAFRGVFDGQNHIIYNMTINTTQRYCGFFGYLNGAAVRRLGIENANVTSSGNDVAILSGYAQGSTIERCYVTGAVKGYAAVSGLLGSTYSTLTTVQNCYARVDLKPTGGRGDTAGISGWNSSSSISIINCYSACIGELRPIAGWSDGAAVPNEKITNTYFDKTLSPNFSSSSGRTDLGRTSGELKQQNNYINWDFSNTWTIDPAKNGGYPYLQGFIPGLGGAPGSISITVTDTEKNPVTDATVIIKDSNQNETVLNHQGDGVYSGTVTSSDTVYDILVNGDKVGNITQSGNGAVSTDVEITPSPADTHLNHPVCGLSCTHGDPAHAELVWTAWESADSMPHSGGNYYLKQDVRLDSRWDVDANINLCLNGHTVTGPAVFAGSDMPRASVQVKSGASLTVCDCAGEAGGINGVNALYCAAGGTLSIYQGHFTGAGSAIVCDGTVSIYGGSYEADSYVIDTTGYPDSTFGKLYLTGSPVLTLSGTGSVSAIIKVGNKESIDAKGYRGSSATIDCAGVDIGETVVSSVDDVNKELFTLVSEDYILKQNGTDLVLAAKLFDLQTAINESSGTAGQPEVITIPAGGIAITATITIPSGKYVTLTGGALTRAASCTGNMFEAVAGNSSLTLENITLDGNKGEVPSAGNILKFNKGGTLTINNGAVLENNANTAISFGAGYNVTANLVMNGGSITGNSSTGMGGAINLGDNGGTINFTMNGGVISNNTAVRGGGAISDTGWGSTTIRITDGSLTGNTVTGTDADATYGGAIYSNSVLIVTGGEISGNSVLYGRGGGIYKAAGGSSPELVITGGTIRDNTARTAVEAERKGHNVYVVNSTFTLGGSANIPNGLYLDLRSKPFQISSALENKVEIEGIYGYPEAGDVVASGKDYTITPEDLAKFSYKDDAFWFTLQNNQIKLASVTCTVALPAGEGYTVTGSSDPVVKGGSYSFTLALADTYYKTAAFAVKANGVLLTEHNGSYTISDIVENQTVTVEGVAQDMAAPSAQITLGSNHWTSFLNTITFGLFFKETQTVEITADDADSGVEKVQYLLTDAVYSDGKELNDANVSWTDYTGTFTMAPNSRTYIYAKATDQVGNVAFIRSDGIVLYTDSAQDTGSISFTKTGVSDVTAQVKLNGNTVKEIQCGGTVLTKNVDYTVSSEGEITFKAVWLDTLAADVKPYILTVSYHPLGMEYAEKDGNAAPAATEIALTVSKAAGSVKELSDPSKVYDGQPVEDASFTALSSGAARVEYKLRNADDSTYSAIKPSVRGDYTLRVSVAGDENYGAASATKDFTISYLEAPQVPYTLSGIQGENGWFRSDVEILPPAGWTISTALNGIYGEKLTLTGSTDGETVYLKNAQGQMTDGIAAETVKIDKTAPEGEITIASDKWGEFLNAISFGLFFNKNVDVSITASDTGSGVKSIQYFRSETGLSENEVKVLTGWSDYKELISETAKDAVKFVYYVKISDDAGNVTYISSDGAVFDIMAPAVSGVSDGSTYYTTQIADVQDANLESVTLNGEDVTGAVALPGNREEAYTITAVDKAGNSTVVTVTMKPVSTIAEPIDSITEDQVTSADITVIEAVKAAAEAVDQRNAADEEKAALQEILDRCQAMLEKIQAVSDEAKAVTDGVDGYDPQTVNSSDKENIESLVSRIDSLLMSGNLTEGERSLLDAVREAAAGLLDNIAETTAEYERVNDASEQYSPDTVKSSDKEEIEKLIGDIDILLTTQNLTEPERNVLHDSKTKLEGLLAKLQDVAELLDQLEKEMGGYTSETVKSTDEDAVRQIVEEAKMLQETGNLTAEEKKVLSEIISKGEELLEKISEISGALNEIRDQAENIDFDQADSEDQSSINDLVENIEGQLSGGHLTDDEKAELEELKDRLEELLDEIGKASEAVKEAGKGIEGIHRDNVKPEDKAALEEAKNAYEKVMEEQGNHLTEAEKKEISDQLAEIDALLELIDRIENPSPGTGDNSRLFLWFILTLLSGGAALTLAARGRRKKNL